MTGETRWACVIGNPARHSLSPALHNAAFQALGIDARYEVREVEPSGLDAVLDSLLDPACLGANVTAPYKQAVIPRLRTLTPEARMMTAVNTIIRHDDALDGDNTDALGLLTWMQSLGVHTRGTSALVLGAGGAARAVVLALARGGVREVRVVNRTPARADQLVADLAPHVPDIQLSAGVLAEAAGAPAAPVNLVINATSLAHQGGAPDVHPGWFAAGSFAAELGYNPPESGFMRTARAAGARAENGLGMLIHQAIRGFELWTGITPPLEVYQEAALRALRERQAAAEARP